MIKLNQKWQLRIICLILAIVLWFVIINEQNPTSEGSYTVPVTVENLNSQYIAANVPKTVYVRLSGPRNTIINVGASDIKAYIDLSNAQEGEMEVPIHVQIPNGTELKKQAQNSAKIYIDVYAVQEFKLTPHLNGKLPDNVAISSLRMVPDTVVVSGARRLIQQVDRAIIDIPVGDKNQDFSVMAPIHLVHADGSPVDGLEMTPWQSKVNVKLLTDAVTKRVPVYVTTTGDPADGYTVKRISPIPESVEIRGRSDVVGTVSGINLAAVNVSGISETKDFEMSAPSIDGAVFAPDTIKVTVEVGKDD
ncbi:MULTISPECIES: CdaR family protein [unclassified Megasphaera]|uniref:CdaR family protein n=1 Tax=unclassified Megasphaera TaxID=2626256 RepID=UPI000EBEC6E2|nr:CdaR family protein [Megasphaera sp. UBA4233]HAM04051.1 hypothetical protein [Megasphaera sp.]